MTPFLYLTVGFMVFVGAAWFLIKNLDLHDDPEDAGVLLFVLVVCLFLWPLAVLIVGAWVGMVFFIEKIRKLQEEK